MQNDERDNDKNNEGEILLINKPLDFTSFDVVQKIRKIRNIKKVGHAGTLDPKATGLLIICTGKKTKSITAFMDYEKEYEGTMQLGAVTPSFDTETTITETKPYQHITEKNINDVLKKFLGEQLQIPPMYSALKHKGKPLYTLARKGKTIERNPRKIVISELEIKEYKLPFVQFRVTCSKGTYIRSLVKDIGEQLECGAYLTQLQRTRIGTFHLSEAKTLEQLSMVNE